MARIGWYKKDDWVTTFWSDGRGHILISDGTNVTDDIVVDTPCCDVCNVTIGADREDGSQESIFFDGSMSLCRECGQKAERRLLADMVASVKENSFIKGYTATDAEALGILIARFFQWDGLAILRAAQYALEDANFHGESAKVSDMADTIENGREP